MRPTRKIVAEFAGVFLIGSAVGVLVMWDLTDTKLIQFMSKTNDPDSVIVARLNQKYAKEYNLNPEELERIQPLLKEMAQHVSQIRHQFGADMLTTLDTYHQKIAEQLTPEHRDAYLKATAERRKQISNLLSLDCNSTAAGAK